jgi:hypothetical protein
LGPDSHLPLNGFAGGSMTMKKRTFLKLGSAILGNPFVSPMFRWIEQIPAKGADGPGDDELKNWAGN